MSDKPARLFNREFPPERTKLIVLTDAPANPLRKDSNVQRLALRTHEDVVWVREMQAAVTFVHGGLVLRQDSIHSDYYGFLTAADELIQESLPSLQSIFKVTADSSLEITVRGALVDTPTLGYAETAFGRRKYHEIGNRVFLAGDIPDDVDFFGLPWDDKVVCRPILHSVAEVWSSSRTLEQNMAAMEAFKHFASTGDRVVAPVMSMDEDLSSLVA